MAVISNEHTAVSRRALVRAAGAIAVATLPLKTSSAAAPPEKAPLMSPWTESGYVPVTGGRMYWASVGEGPPLVVMPKLGGWIADYRHVVPALSKKFRVIGIDNPGHGNSEVYGPPPYLLSLRESAAKVMSTLSALNVTRFSAIGNSLGGCILTTAAASWPDAVEKLVLLSVTLRAARPLSELAEMDRQQLGTTYNADGSAIARSFEAVSARFGVKDKAVFEEQNASRAKAGPWLQPSGRGVGNSGLIDYLPRITADTLLVYGEDGGYKEFEAVAKTRLKKSQSTFIARSGSFPHQENPAATADALLKFLS